MITSQQKIKQLLNFVQAKKILKDIGKMRQYNDEVKIAHHFGRLTFHKELTDGYSYKDGSSVSGLSFDNPEDALLKCLMEGVERFSVSNYKNTSIAWESYEALMQKGVKAVNPDLFTSNYKKNMVIGWVKGFNAVDNDTYYMPAQLVYLYYKRDLDECIFNYPSITTGAAAGFDHNTALLRGIYEIVERDALMSIYLNKISAPKVDLSTVGDKTVQSILTKCERYKLELNVYDITTDIKIPTFMGILIDRTGIGPAVTVGAKTDFTSLVALKGSMLEPFLTRTWLRSELTKINRGSKHNLFKINPTLKERGLFWSHPNMIQKLDFLLNQQKIQYVPTSKNVKKTEELKIILKSLNEKGFNVYYSDVTLPMFKKLNCLVYKVVIPGFQPLYLNEFEKNITLNKRRLKRVAAYFGQRNKKINSIPHPFL